MLLSKLQSKIVNYSILCVRRRTTRYRENLLQIVSFSSADKPSKPTGPLKVEEVRSDHVTVKWQKPEDNGGTDITGYVLEKMDMDTGRWIPAGEVGPNDYSFTFGGLTPKKKYKFRVKAVNKEGESEPLEVDEAILAKNPYGK